MSAEAPAALHPVTAAHSEQNGDVPGATAKRRSAEPPLKSKILIALAIQAFFLSILIAYFEPHVPIMNAIADRLDSMDIPILDWFLSDGDEDGATKETGRPNDPLNADLSFKLFSRSDLAAMTGEKGGPVHLAVLGKVYDVSKGRKHYGPGGGYSFFAGRDASRAYVTGDFSPAGLTDDVSGLSNQDYLGLHDWYTFYDKDYEHIGYLSGTYYYPDGTATENLRDVMRHIDEAQEWKNEQASKQERFPSCNSEWSQKAGGRVWCTNKSGGVRRDWAGVPRRLFTPGTRDWRCACVKNTGAPLDDDLPDTGTGDVRHPSLKTYANCGDKADSCPLPDDDK